MNLAEFKELSHDDKVKHYNLLKKKKDDHYQLMLSRVQEDVKINVCLWEDLSARLVDMYTHVKKAVDKGLVDGTRMSSDEFCFIDQYKQSSGVDDYINRLLTFLMYKMDTARVREDTGILLDKPKVQEGLQELGAKIFEAKVQLEGVMPPVPKYAVKNYPKNPTKKDGTLSASGKSWNEAIEGLDKTDDYGTPLTITIEGEPNKVKVLKGYDAPNINSNVQLKKFLYSHGWEPRTFEYKKDEKAQQAWVDSGFRKELKPKMRAIPQIQKAGDEGKELCPSVQELADKIPEIKYYANYTLFKHREGLLNAYLKNEEDGYIFAGVNGFTNTLREQHRSPVCNLPGVDKPYGGTVRGALTCEADEVLLGSDLSSLEDRVKMHFMMPHDPDYVNTMTDPNYDSHITMALTAGMISEEQFEKFMLGEKDDFVTAKRKLGKTANYACLPKDVTEILTDSGWKYFNQLKKEDLVLSYNEDSGESEFNKIDAFVEFEDKEILTMSTRDWKLESTDDHRWLVSRRSKSSKRVREILEYRKTSEMNTECKIISSTPYAGGGLEVTPKEAAVFGWILSDGYIKWSEFTGGPSQAGGKKLGVKCQIHQHTNKFSKEVRSDLNEAGIRFTHRIRENGVEEFNLNRDDVRSLWSKLGLYGLSGKEGDLTKLIMSLSKECLEEFLHAFWLADGQTSKGTNTYGTKVIYQNSGSVCDAVHLCSELLGRNTYTSENSWTKREKGVSFSTINSRRDGLLGMQNTKTEYVGNRSVFCLTTQNGNFFIRQGGFISLTGNCVYGAGPETIARNSGMSLEDAKKLHKAYWELNWAVKAIAEDQYTFECSRGQRWLINPINGFCYSIRADKDIFSTLIQGTGSFFFDVWVSNILDEMYERFGFKKLTLLMHDEYATPVEDNPENRKQYEEMTYGSIDKVNQTFRLRRDLGCDVQWGNSYADIH